MSLEVGGIDHKAVGLAYGPRQTGDDAVEHADAASAHEAIVERLVRVVVRWGIPPARAGADHVHDTAENVAIVDPRNAMRESGEKGEMRAICASESRNQSSMPRTSAPHELPVRRRRKPAL